MIVDILLVILVLVLCLCIAWKLGASVLGGIIHRTGDGGEEGTPTRVGGASTHLIDPSALALLDQYASAPDATALAASRMSYEIVNASKHTRALLNAIQYHWLYAQKPTSAARAGSAAALAVVKNALTPAQKHALTVVRSADETSVRPVAPSAADYFLEKSMNERAGKRVDAVACPPAPGATAAMAAQRTAEAELRAMEAQLRAAEAAKAVSEASQRAVEAELRAARDDIRRLKDTGALVPNLSTVSFLAECNADRKVLQDRVYALRQEVANALAAARPDPSPQLQAIINDLTARNARLQAQLAGAVDSSQIAACQAELANCRRLLDEVLSAQ